MYTKLTDSQKAIVNPESIFASGESNYFDTSKQSYDNGTEVFNNDNNFVIQPNTYLYSGYQNNTINSQSPLIAPFNLSFSGVVVSGINYLSNSQLHIPSNIYPFQLINSYIHYMPHPNGGAGLVDQTDFYYGYDPASYAENENIYFKYGEP